MNNKSLEDEKKLVEYRFPGYIGLRMEMNQKNRSTPVAFEVQEQDARD